MGKGHLCALMGHLAFYIRALIATAQPGNFPVNLSHCPWRSTVKGGGIKGPGGGGRLHPQNSNTQKCPFSKLKVKFLKQTCPLCWRKGQISSRFVSLNVPFCPHREGTTLAKGHMLCLVGEFSPSCISALIATTEPGNCPRESFFPDGAQL